MYMGKDDFDMLHRELGQLCNYEAMRHDVADLCFSGNSNFSVDEAIAYGVAAGGIFGVGGGLNAEASGAAASTD